MNIIVIVYISLVIDSDTLAWHILETLNIDIIQQLANNILFNFYIVLCGWSYTEF
jgi:hypothetical protein